MLTRFSALTKPVPSRALWRTQPARNILLHEYQAAHLLHQYNIPIPRGNVAFNSKEAFVIARKFGTDYARRFVIKAQVQCQGRSKGTFRESGLRSGIHIVESIEQVAEVSAQMCGKHLISPQMPNNKVGYLCQSVLIMEKLSIKKECFISIEYDRKRSCPVIIYSDRGGITLPRIEMNYPESIHKIYVDPRAGLDLK